MKIFYSLLLVLLFTACGTSTLGVKNLDEKVKKLEIGMSKKQTLKILGKDYDLVAVSKTPEGNLETLRFVSVVGTIYIVNILDGEFVEFYVEKPYTEPHPHPHPIH